MTEIHLWAILFYVVLILSLFVLGSWFFSRLTRKDTKKLVERIEALEQKIESLTDDRG